MAGVLFVSEKLRELEWPSDIVLSGDDGDISVRGVLQLRERWRKSIYYNNAMSVM